MKRSLWLLSVLAVCLFISGCSTTGGASESKSEEDSHIEMVKNGCPSNYPDSPYGEVFNDYFENPDWNYFQAENEDGEVVDIVEFTGECKFEKEDRKAQIQFTVDEDKNSFDATYLALDGEAQTVTKLQELLTAAYASQEAAVSGRVGVPAEEKTEATTAAAATATAAATTAATAAQAPAVVVVPSAPATEAPSYSASSGSNYYILPNSSSYRLSKSDISHLSKSELRLARNEIYARHGRMFDSDDLQNYFNSQAWYTPIYTPDEFKDSWLSDVETDNIALIKSYE